MLNGCFHRKKTNIISNFVFKFHNYTSCTIHCTNFCPLIITLYYYSLLSSLFPSWILLSFYLTLRILPLKPLLLFLLILAAPHKLLHKFPTTSSIPVPPLEIPLQSILLAIFLLKLQFPNKLKLL